jgi:uncharacterized protein
MIILLTKGVLNRYNKHCLFGVNGIDFNFKDVFQKESLHVHDEWIWSFQQKNTIEHIPVHLDIQLYTLYSNVELKGTLSLHVTASCSRCLKLFVEPLVIPIHEIFSREPSENEIIEPNMHVITGEHVNLDTYFEENIIMGLPYVPLCEPACKGLCNQCGIDLNEQDCACSPQLIDPRLEKLSDFFKNT